jgi:hypothetical protein
MASASAPFILLSRPPPWTGLPLMKMMTALESTSLSHRFTSDCCLRIRWTLGKSNSHKESFGRQKFPQLDVSIFQFSLFKTHVKTFLFSQFSHLHKLQVFKQEGLNGRESKKKRGERVGYHPKSGKMIQSISESPQEPSRDII